MKRNYRFLGEEVAPSDRDRVYVIPVPVEWSTTYVKGTRFAPRKILSSSRQIELYNADLDLNLEGSGIVTVDEELTCKEELVGWIRENREMLLNALPCFVGGEHSITPWILEALDPGEIGIVWFDAHADLRESYEGSDENHACAARNAGRFGRIVEVGVRSYSVEEKDFLLGTGHVKVFRRYGDAFEDAVAELPERIYMSFDFDAVDPSLIAAVGTPEPDGLSWREIISSFDMIFSKKKVVAVDFVELAPRDNDETSNFIAAKIIYEAVSRFLMYNSS